MRKEYLLEWMLQEGQTFPKGVLAACCQCSQSAGWKKIQNAVNYCLVLTEIRLRY